jgi:Mn2+/Fe2+ NRAMP family transporter
LANLTFLPPIDTSSEVGLTAAMIGWMPAPLDIAVWSSLWALARARTSGNRLDSRAVLRDFDVGYMVTLVLAICFVLLGASIMYNTDRTFSPSSSAFAGEVVLLYTEQLGSWSWPLIAGAAFLAMLSTTVTVADGFPRAVAALISEAWPERKQGPEGSKTSYWVVFIVGAIGAMLVLFYTLGREGVSFTHLVDFVTITSFIAAPILAFLNHRVALSPEVPPESRPSPWLRAWSCFGIVVMATFALGYIGFRLGIF